MVVRGRDRSSSCSGGSLVGTSMARPFYFRLFDQPSHDRRVSENDEGLTSPRA